MVPGEKEAATSESLERIQELLARKERAQEKLAIANRTLFEAKENRDNLLLSIYAIDHQVELLQDGQLPMFGDDE
jgi:hypothetical protein